MKDINVQDQANTHPFPPTRTLFAACIAVALTLALAACGSSGGSKTASKVDITVQDFFFSPTKPVKAGSTVTVHNNGPSTHTVTSDDSGRTFNVTVNSGQDATFKAPMKPGTYKFHCSIHTQMTGTLTVT